MSSPCEKTLANESRPNKAAAIRVTTDIVSTAAVPILTFLKHCVLRECYAQFIARIFGIDAFVHMQLHDLICRQIPFNLCYLPMQ